MSLADKLKADLDLKRLVNKKFVLSVSGGVDSMVMLDLLAGLISRADLLVVSFDHQVRSNSGLDLKLVEETCGRRGVEFIGRKLCFEEGGGSFENQARVERYKFLEQVRVEKRADLVCTGHNLNDVVETIFLKMLQGTFVKGLSGIAKLDVNRSLYRPLLDFQKSELYQYAQEKGVSFREDESNEEVDFDRNFLRKEILPKLGKRFVGFEKVMAEKAEFFGELQGFLEGGAQAELARLSKFYLDKVRFLAVESFLKLEGFLRFEILKILVKEEISVARFKDFMRFVNEAQNGREYRFEEVVVYKCLNSLYFRELSMDLTELKLALRDRKPDDLPYFLRESY